MKKSNKEFVAEFMNQLDSGKLVQVIQGLLNQEEITIENTPVIVSKSEIVEEIPTKVENNETNITIEKLSVSEKPSFASVYTKDDDNDEKIVSWFAQKAQPYLEPKKPLEVQIETDLYGLMFTTEGKIEAERLRTLKEAEAFAKLSPQEQIEALEIKNVLEKQEILRKLQLEQKKDALKAVEKAKFLPKDYISTFKSKDNNDSPLEKMEKSRAEQEAEAYKAAEYRVDNNIRGRSFAENFLDQKVKNDRLAREINQKMTEKGYQDTVFTSLQTHIRNVQQKNKELEEKEKLQPQVEAIEKELDELLLQDFPEIT